MKALTTPKLQNEIAEIEADLAEQCTPAQASEAVNTLLGSYPQRNVNNPDVYVTQLTILIQRYPASVAKQLVHPADGIVARCRFLPTIAEVKEVADELTGNKRGRIAKNLMTIREREREATELEIDRSLPSPEERDDMAEYLKQTIRNVADGKTIN